MEILMDLIKYLGITTIMLLCSILTVSISKAQGESLGKLDLAMIFVVHMAYALMIKQLLV